MVNGSSGGISMHSDARTPFPIAYHSITRFNDQIFCFGGEFAGGKLSDSAYRTTGGMSKQRFLVISDHSLVLLASSGGIRMTVSESSLAPTWPTLSPSPYSHSKSSPAMLPSAPPPSSEHVSVFGM